MEIVMNLICKQCVHTWKTRKNIKPKVCPRCKSKSWDKKRERPWEKQGYLYLIVLPKNIIKVGQTKTGSKRLGAYTGIAKCVYSGRIKDLNSAEKLLIQEAKRICGDAYKGREYFIGGEKEFYCLKEFINENYGIIDKANDFLGSQELKKIFISWAIGDTNVFCDSELLAKVLGAKHNKVIRTIKNVLKNFDNFKDTPFDVEFKINYHVYRGKDFISYSLNKEAFFFTIIRFDSKIARHWLGHYIGLFM